MEVLSLLCESFCTGSVRTGFNPGALAPVGHTLSQRVDFLPRKGGNKTRVKDTGRRFSWLIWELLPGGTVSDSFLRPPLCLTLWVARDR